MHQAESNPNSIQSQVKCAQELSVIVMAGRALGIPSLLHSCPLQSLQAGVGLVGSALGGGPTLSRNFHAALEDSVAMNFQDNHVINCMCH